MSDKEQNVYCTRDLYLASTLVTLKFYMCGLDFQIEGERPMPVGYFNFVDDQKLQEAIQKYWQGQLSVEPRQFITNLRSLKAQVMNVYKSPKVNLDKFKNTSQDEEKK